MAEIVLDRGHQGLRRRLRSRQGHGPRDRRRRVHDPRRALGLRQVDGAADDRRAGGHHRGRAADRRRGRQRPLAEGPRHRDGLPELRALPAHDGAREHGLRARSWPRVDKAEIDRKVEEAARDARPHPAPRPQPGQPLRRPAPAGGDGAGDRARPEGLPDGRAALQPRREAAGADAHRGRPAAVATWTRRPSTSPTTRPRR